MYNVKKIKNKMIVAALVCASAISTQANAGIIINVTNNGGDAEFSFSGSDTVVQAGEINNGFWLNDLLEANAITGTPNFYGEHSISGSADLLINNTSYDVDDVWVNGDRYDFELGFRDINSNHPRYVSVGDTIGLSGSILTNLNYSFFNEGSYNFSSVGPYAEREAVVSENIIFNVGAKISNDIPEPTSLALLGLAFAGVGFSRRKK